MLLWGMEQGSDRKILDAGGDKEAARIEEGMEVYGRIFDENCTYHVTPYDGIREASEGTERARREAGSAFEQTAQTDSQSCK